MNQNIASVVVTYKTFKCCGRNLEPKALPGKSRKGWNLDWGSNPTKILKMKFLPSFPAADILGVLEYSIKLLTTTEWYVENNLLTTSSATSSPTINAVFISIHYIIFTCFLILRKKKKRKQNKFFLTEKNPILCVGKGLVHTTNWTIRSTTINTQFVPIFYTIMTRGSWTHSKNKW